MPSVKCNGCEYLGDDGGGPGPVMICEHPYFSDKDCYAGAICEHDFENRGTVISNECPKVRKENTMPKVNQFKDNTFSDLWAKADYVKRLADQGASQNPIDEETLKCVNGLVGDLYRALEKKFGDKRIKPIIEYAFKEPSRIMRADN